MTTHYQWLTSIPIMVMYAQSLWLWSRVCNGVMLHGLGRSWGQQRYSRLILCLSVHDNWPTSVPTTISAMVVRIWYLSTSSVSLSSTSCSSIIARMASLWVSMMKIWSYFDMMFRKLFKLALWEVRLVTSPHMRKTSIWGLENWDLPPCVVHYD
jgi:hypothetical protein